MKKHDADNNGIFKKENENLNLEKLVAQYQIYSDAKNILGIQIITQVVLVIILALMPIFIDDYILNLINMKKETLKLIIIVSSIILMLIDLIIITPRLNLMKESAATIQEDFDCTVLSILWNDIKVNKPDLEVISSNYNKYISKNGDIAIDRFRNWYSSEAIKILPLPVARIICQRTNCWWDSALRKKFKRDTILCAVILFFILFLIGLVKGISVSNLITNIIFPFLPAFAFTIRQVQSNTKSIKCTERLKGRADSLWQKILSESEQFDHLNDLSRKLQDEIFENRRNSPLIFDWYYKRYKSQQQIDTDFTGETMVNSYNISRCV